MWLDQCDGYRNSSRISPTWSKGFWAWFCFGGYVYWDFCSPVSRNATDRKDQNHAHGAVSSSSEFLSLTLFCFATASCASCDLDRLFCGGGLWCAWIVISSWPFCLSPRYLDSSDLALPLSQIQGTTGSCNPLSQIPAHFHYLCLGFIKLSRWKNWKSPAAPLVGPSGDHSQSLCSLSLQKPYGNRFCLELSWSPYYDWYSKWKNMLQKKLQLLQKNLIFVTIGV